MLVKRLAGTFEVSPERCPGIVEMYPNSNTASKFRWKNGFVRAMK